MKDSARPATPGQPSQPGQQPDRYQKFLPEWMKGNGAKPIQFRAARPRRPKQPRSAGGYTPGKFAVGE